MSQSPSLLPAGPSDDHVALELFFVRYGKDDSAISQSLWSAVDEQAIDVEVRRRLGANGFVAGRVGGQLPPAIADLLHLSDDRPAPTVEEPPEIVPSKAPIVHRKLIDVYQVETPNRIVVTGERQRHEKLVVLFRDENDGGSVHGQTFREAQGSLSAKVVPQADGRVKLDLVPEVEHGEPRREITPTEGGSWQYVLASPRKTFDSLRFSAVLAPGEMLVVGCRSGRPGSLGQQFFTEHDSDATSRIVLLVRVLRSASGDLFRSEPLSTDAGQ